MLPSALTPATKPPWLSIADAIATAFTRAFEPGKPRHLQLQNAITQLIQTGSLQAGAQLPPDQHLTIVLGVSLGTVQKALSLLASAGWVSREHGRGTFIEGPRQPVNELWHYRFFGETGEQLPVYSKLLRRQKLAANADVEAQLGKDAKGYIEIERLVNIGGKFDCYSQIYLGSSKFSEMLRFPKASFEDVNLKKIFTSEFGTPTINVKQWICALAFSADIAEAMGLSKGASGMLLEVVGLTHGRQPFSFQRIYIPTTTYPLDISPTLPAREKAI